MINPNLPVNIINNVLVSCDTNEKILYNLASYGITPIKLTGYLKCDDAVKNHPDIYVTHVDESTLFLARNNCSVDGVIQNYIKTEFPPFESYIYPHDAVYNCVALGKRLIGNLSIINREIIICAESLGYELINVNQGYTKCNVCVVDENSIITEDVGIYNALTKNGLDVLLLEKNCVQIKKYSHGFIGGASGKISFDKLAFTGDIKKHPEFDKIFRFLFKRGIEAVSLSDGILFDYGSIIPLE